MVVYTVRIGFIHLSMLFVQNTDNFETIALPVCQSFFSFVEMVPNDDIDTFQIPEEIVQLLLFDRSDALFRFLLRFRETVVFFFTFFRYVRGFFPSVSPAL